MIIISLYSKLDSKDSQILEKIEEKIGRKIPKVNFVRWIEEFPNKSFVIKHQVGYVAENKHITRLGLSNLKLSNLPEEIGNLEYLEELDAINNLINQIPLTICILKNLKELRLYKNQIKQISDCISRLEKLQYLNLGVNQLTKIPESLGFLNNLIELNLCFNQIAQIPKTIGNCRKLEVINLDNNLLYSIPEEISQLVNLRILRLAGNQIKKLPQNIGNLKNLRELIVLQNKLEYLPDSIGNLINLKKINASYNLLSILPQSLRNLRNLELFDITKNNFPRLAPCLNFLPNSKQICIDDDILKHEPKLLKDLDKYKYGIIKIDSGEITVSDPLMGISKESTFITRKGNWKIYLVLNQLEEVNNPYQYLILPHFDYNNKTRIASIIVVHEDYEDLKLIPEDWEEITLKKVRFVLGIFDALCFPEKTPFKGKLEKIEEQEKFHRTIEMIATKRTIDFYYDKGCIVNLESNEKYNSSNVKYPLFIYKNNRGFVVILWIDFTSGELFENFNYILG
ncbi:MAG: leucine-rich repeat domain-containing protein [Promethearchaeota archaeon]